MDIGDTVETVKTVKTTVETVKTTVETVETTVETVKTTVETVKTVKVDATVTFTYVESDCRVTKFNKWCVGKLERLKGDDERVCIDMGSLGQADAFLHSFSHKSYLPVRLITDSEPFTILHQHFSSTMVDYIGFLKSENIFPLFTYTFPNHTETAPNVYKCVSEEFRLLVRELVDFVLHLQSMDKSLVHLDVGNLCVLNGQLRVWGIRFKEKDNDSVKKDFEFLYNVTNVIFGLGYELEKGNKLPVDFDNVLGMMMRWSGSEPIKNHLGLLSAKEKIVFVRNICDFLRGLPPNEKARYNSALMQSGSNQGWKRKVTWGPLVQCLNFKGSKYLDRGPNLLVNTSLISFCRNAVSHLHEEIAKSLDPARTVESMDLECYVMQHFSRILINFKKELGIEKIAHIFE